MILFIEIIFLTSIVLTNIKSRDDGSLNQFYVQERGTKVTLLLFEDQNIIYLSYFKPGRLGLCIESSFSIKGDTLNIEKLGQFLIKRKQLKGFYDDGISTRSKYKSVNQIEKYVNCLSTYGIYLDSLRVVIPRNLIGDP